MVRYESDCVGPCPMGCIGSGCPNRRVPHYYCDECGDEVGADKLRECDGRQLCDACILEQFDPIGQEF